MANFALQVSPLKPGREYCYFLKGPSSLLSPPGMEENEIGEMGMAKNHRILHSCHNKILTGHWCPFHHPYPHRVGLGKGRWRLWRKRPALQVGGVSVEMLYTRDQRRCASQKAASTTITEPNLVAGIPKLVQQEDKNQQSSGNSTVPAT